ncbi:MAG: ModD protein [Bacteroidetes bacterium RBG_13_46_8]|nr:MAG: ModD protein [Bacteroidetes bacterium RBG_13_46_8]
MYFTDKEIDELLIEDLPYFDLTTSLLRLENKPAKIQFFTREDTLLCCTEEVMKIFGKVGIQVTLFTPSGEFIEKGIKFFEGEGLAKNIQAVLRVSENLLGYASGIATRTRNLIGKAREINPSVIVASTRKTIPFTRKIAMKAVQAGGAAIYRLGLSESVLVFENHYSFLGGLANLDKRIKEQKNLIAGKIITVEVKNPDDALAIASSGIDIIQIERLGYKEIRALKKEIHTINPGIKIAVTGNINIDTVEEYAKTGADILVTSWPYYGEPSDLMVTVAPIFDVY